MTVPGRVEDPDLLETADTSYECGGAAVAAYLAHPKATAEVELSRSARI